jgi:hypothetical protein
MSEPTDVAIQLFIQATILLSSYYHFETTSYTVIRERSAQAGFSTLPFVPPETVRATPDLVTLANTSDPEALANYVVNKYGYKPLVKYYIRTGLRASQLICRNYLLNLDERNQYLEFLKKEFGVAYGLASGILAAVNANGTLSNAFMISNAAIIQGADIYQDYRFLTIDREAARVLVETAQNKFAEHFMKQVDLATNDSTSTTGGYTFADALNAVSTIEYQCTREGIKGLLNRSINNTPSNLEIDANTGAVMFISSTDNTLPAAAQNPPVKKSAPPPATSQASTTANQPAPAKKANVATNQPQSPATDEDALTKQQLNNFADASVTNKNNLVATLNAGRQNGTITVPANSTIDDVISQDTPTFRQARKALLQAARDQHLITP